MTEHGELPDDIAAEAGSDNPLMVEIIDDQVALATDLPDEGFDYGFATGEGYPFQFPWYLRFVLGSVGLVLAVLLITAAMLKPAEKGYGTHQQLGLPPCTFQVMFDGKPCPSCGMTTSWSHLTKGQIVSSLRANPGGTFLGILSMVLSPWLIASSIKGNWFISEPPTWLALTVGLSLLTVIFGNWTYQLLK